MPLDLSVKKRLIEHYRRLFKAYGAAPEACQYTPNGQRFRFEKLCQIAPLAGKRILDVGCGLGSLYPFLMNKFGAVDYTGVDIVPETIAYATKACPGARFFCQDLLEEPLSGKFDYVLISGLFGNNGVAEGAIFLKEMVEKAFGYCTAGLAFNFISTYMNYLTEEMAYQDPVEVLEFCLKRLSPKATLFHHYERCDVAVFVYRQTP